MKKPAKKAMGGAMKPAMPAMPAMGPKAKKPAMGGMARPFKKGGKAKGC